MKALKSTSKLLLGGSAFFLGSIAVSILCLSMLQALPWSPPPAHLMDNYHAEGTAE